MAAETGADGGALGRPRREIHLTRAGYRACPRRSHRLKRMAFVTRWGGGLGARWDSIAAIAETITPLVHPPLYRHCTTSLPAASICCPQRQSLPPQRQSLPPQPLMLIPQLPRHRLVVAQEDYAGCIAHSVVLLQRLAHALHLLLLQRALLRLALPHGVYRHAYLQGHCSYLAPAACHSQLPHHVRQADHQLRSVLEGV